MNRKQAVNSFLIVAFTIFLFCVPLLTDNVYFLYILSMAWINVLMASSLRTITLTGEMSLGQVGFMLVGAYSSALLALKVGISVWLTMGVGGLLAAAIAIILAYPILRTKGVYFSVLTLLIAEILRLAMWYIPSLSGGPAGLAKIPSPGAIGIPGLGVIDFASKTVYYYLLLVMVLFSLIILFRLEQALGLTWLAIRQNDELAESVGINVIGHKIAVFVIACFFAGISGAFFAHFMRLLTTDVTAMFGMLTSIYVVMYMVVGGQARFAGPIIGAIFLTLVPELARPLKQYQPIIFGALVIFIIFFMREGLIALPRYLSTGWRKAMGHPRKTANGISNE
jgi:branched-chain amino acid transport system permease protein